MDMPLPGNEPFTILWESGLSLFGPGRPNNEYVTSHRVQAFARIAEAMVRSQGLHVIDIVNMTRSRWESSWDGLHMACQLDGDNWGSQVASMVYQITLNVILGECVS